MPGPSARDCAGRQALDEYRRKRGFSRTGEPRGGRGRRGTRPRFVVQHDASTEHYDFRLEAGGGRLTYAGKVGTGFDEATLASLRRDKDPASVTREVARP
jgi:ATP-dependent DNA ligase